MKQFTGLVVSLTLPVAYAFGGEAPMLEKMVDAGKLPPLEERLPENPLVENPVNEVGEYGGKLVLGTAFFLDDERLPSRVDRNGFFQFSYPFPAEGPIKPNLAESWNWNSDGTKLTINMLSLIHI